MSTMTPVEYIGGPSDGFRHFVLGQPLRLTVSVYNQAAIVEHWYERRTVNGSDVRLDNGCVPYDWLPDPSVKERTAETKPTVVKLVRKLFEGNGKLWFPSDADDEPI